MSINNWHIGHLGDVEYCGDPGSCGSTFGHYPTNEKAIAERLMLATQGRLYLAGVEGAGSYRQSA